MQRKWRRDWQRGRSQKKDGAAKKRNPFHILARSILPAVTAASIMLSSVSGVYANPTNGQIISGTGTISENGSTMTINQTSDKLGINWQSFSIGADETVNFNQPGRNSIALNRIIGSDASKIYGHLNANGKVFLINTNGIIFAPGASVNVGGIVASSLNISDSDFLAGNYTFTGNGAPVTNQGTITAANGGYVALLGSQVTNDGIIVAQQGTVALGAGKSATLDLVGDGLLNLAVDQAALNSSVANHNLIQANGGTVIMTAKAADALIDTVVSNNGMIEAKSINNVNGVIRLDAGPAGTVTNSGTLDASGKQAGQTGGTVKVLGKTVTLADGAKVDVSGDTGGGTALIGGNYQGKGPEQNATTTTVTANATINADALTSGNGGKVVVWANDTTKYYGTVSAKGGSVSGNGGLVETSGKNVLDLHGAVDASAAKGAGGQWLLDPNNVTIQAAGSDTNVTGNPNFTTTNDSAIVTTDSIQTALNGGTSVTITTGSAGTNTQDGNINVNSAISWNRNDTTLTLTAVKDININANITASGANAGLALNPTGSYKLTGGAKITLSGSGATFSLNGIGYTVINDYSAGGALQALQNMKNGLTGKYFLGVDVDASTISNWAPVGQEGSGYFGGVFDGGGHVINGLTINNSTAPINYGLGLFGKTGNAAIRNVGLENVNIIYKGSGAVAIGALVGTAYTGTTITNCYSSGSITVQSTAGTQVGGLIGAVVEAEITNSHSDATVLVSGVKNLGKYGGFIGNNALNGRITNSYSTGAVTVTTGSGYTGNVWVGGFAGQQYDNALLQNSYSSGPVSLTYLTAPTGTTLNGRPAVGGLVGYNAASTIQNCYSTSDLTVNAGNTYVGGLVGVGNYISNSYSSGKITNNGSGNFVGGLAGSGVAGKITASYWDTQTSGVSQGVGTITDYSGVTGLTTAQMMDAGSYDTSWTFGNGGTWYMLNGYTRPFLRTEYSTNITNAHQLQLMAMNLNANYTLSASFDASGAFGADSGMWLTQNTMTLTGKTSYGFVPVGGSTNPFKGTLSGNGNIIIGLRISNAGDYAGLFGHIQNATISNLGLEGATVSGGTGGKVGALAGDNDGGTITGVYSSGTVSGGDHTGGLVGYNTGSIADSYSISTVSGNGHVGGLVGTNAAGGQITNTYSAGAVSGGPVSGGLVGFNDGTVSGSVWDQAGSHQSSGVGGGTGAADVTAMNTNGSVPGTWSAALWQDGLTRPILRWQMSNGYIASLDQLVLVNLNPGGRYKLATDIDLTGYLANHTWTPIGTDAAHAFTGSFFGNGYTISGLTINSSATYVGLFGYTQGALISGVNLSGLSITGTGASQYIGGLVGYSDPGTTIAGCAGAGAVTANGAGYVGGLVGENMGSIINSANTATVTANAGGSYVGGLAGRNSTNAVISGSSNAGTVTANGATASYVGGIAGRNNTTATTAGIYGSANTGTVTAHGAGSYVGGITGWNYTGGAIISGSSNAGAVVSTGDGSYVGGLTGQNDGGSQKVSLSFNTGSVTARGKNSYVGGLFGINNQPVADLYNYGTVTSENDGNYVGGLAGKNITTMTRNYNGGTVATTTDGINNIVGGLVGWNTGTMTYSFGSGAVLAQGANNTVGGLVGKNDYRLNNSYSMTVTRGTGAGSIVGGIVGENAAAGVITNVFNVGETTGGSSVGAIGALTGRNNGSFTTALWATDTTGQSTTGIAPGGTGTSSGIQSDTFMNLLSPSKYAGWNTSQWGIVNGVLPYLKWQYPSGLSAALMFTGTVENGTGQTINIVRNGTQIGQAHQFGVNGWYYGAGFAGQTLPAGGAPVLLYVANDPNYKANSIYVAGSTGLANGDLRKDTLIVDCGSTPKSLSILASPLGGSTQTFSSPDLIFAYNNQSGLTVYGDLRATNLDMKQSFGTNYGITAVASGSARGSVTITNTGDFWINDNFRIASGEQYGMQVPGNQYISATGDITIQAGGNIVLRHGATNYTLLSAGGDITLVAGTGFVNSSGPTALSAGGRWLVYAPDQLIYAPNRALYYYATYYPVVWNLNASVIDTGSPSDELIYDARGGLANDFTLWGTSYDPNVVPANAGNGFIFTAAEPALRPLTPAQLQRREAVAAVQSDGSQIGAVQRLETASVPVATTPVASTDAIPFLTIEGEGVATE